MTRDGPDYHKKKKNWIKTLITANDLQVTNHSTCAHTHNPSNAKGVQNKFWSTYPLLLMKHVSAMCDYHAEK